MTRRPYSGLEIVKVLTDKGFTPASGVGSHRKLVYEHPETDEKRIVIVPLHDELATGTLRSIADQAGAKDFDAFCAWIDRNL